MDTKASKNLLTQLFFPGLLVAIVLAGGSFFAGMQYGKHLTANSTNLQPTNGTANNGFNAQRGGFGARRLGGGFGTVTAVSDSSITVNDQRQGASKTYTITASTTVDNNGSTGSVSDIKTGDRVVIQTSASDSTTATRILVNPSFGGGPGSGGGTNSSSGNL